MIKAINNTKFLYFKKGEYLKVIIFRILICLLLQISIIQIAAADQKGVGGESDAGQKIWIFNDPSSSLSMGDILSGKHADRFREVDRIPSFGFTDSSIWIKLQMTGNTGPGDRILEVLYPALDLVELYIPGQSGFVMKRSGETVPFRDREFKHRNHIFKIPSSGLSVQIIYLRIRSESSISAKFTLYDWDEFFQKEYIAQLMWGIFFGILIIMGLYNLFLFFSLRDPSYLFYVIFLASQLLFSFTINGFSVQYLWNDSPQWAAVSHPFFSALLLLCALLFSFVFLNMKKYSKVISAVFMVLTALLVLQLACVLFLPYRVIVTVNMYYSYIFILVMIFTGVYMLRRGFTPALYFLAAWVFFLGGTVVYTVSYNLASASIIHSRNLILENAAGIGTVFMVLFLALALADRINLLRREKDELIKEKELDELKSEFFSNVSHEIRTPLSLILTPVRSIIEGTSSLRPDRELFRMIERNAVKLLDLINTLLEFSRLDAGKTALEAAPANLNEIISGQIALAHSACESEMMTIDFQPADPPFILFLDREKIETVIGNLLINSVKYSGRGTVISIRTGCDEKQAFIEFKDNGPGIPPGSLPHIFERFTRAEASAGFSSEGSGIGLALVKEYIILHGGSISVENRFAGDFPSEHGTVFKISLPAGKEHLLNKKNITLHEKPVSSKQRSSGFFTAFTVGRGQDTPQGGLIHKETERPRIMIVEDTPDMHSLLRGILEPGFQTFCFSGGTDALEFLRSENDPPDLILSDLMMPSMNGIDFVRAVRLEDRLRGIPVMLLTANADAETKIEGLESGAVDYILKPFNGRELLARLNSQLELKQMGERLARSNKLLHRKLEEESRPSGAGLSPVAEEKVKKVIEFINEYYTADITRESLAEAVDISPDYLSRHFNRITGKRIDEYINSLRLKRAAEMLVETESTVLSIAMETGFESLRHFNRLFSGFFGSTPSEYRKNQKK